MAEELDEFLMAQIGPYRMNGWLMKDISAKRVQWLVSQE